MVQKMLDKNGLRYEDVVYLASTGEGDLVKRKRGHFYGMTTMRAALIFLPGSANSSRSRRLYVRCIRINEGAKVKITK